MISHVHQALAQVRTIHQQILEKQRFRGFSGRARALSGCVALLTGCLLARRNPPNETLAVAAWVGVALIGGVINYGALFAWHLSDTAGEANRARLKPTVEVVPALFVGVVFTVVCWLSGTVRLLPGMWMLLFGLANLASRHVLAKGMGWIGLYYLVAGCVMFLAFPTTGLTNPWPMALVFFVGEWAGGLILHLDHPASQGWSGFFGFSAPRPHE